MEDAALFVSFCRKELFSSPSDELKCIFNSVTVSSAHIVPKKQSSLFIVPNCNDASNNPNYIIMVWIFNQDTQYNYLDYCLIYSCSTIIHTNEASRVKWKAHLCFYISTDGCREGRRGQNSPRYSKYFCFVKPAACLISAFNTASARG